ncbi:Hypothetical Protein RRSL_00880 [Ralstonia solanacearum UW551]|uniref:Uncharacterized protein n=1 Tax=Ralstonia solanacearum (strain UW551) TaxID=342110 RepID=A0AB33V8A4_RALSU|nr:Hypothetical Protein RRSL_00880 [Ralstonia solanacearum UW551]
MFAVFSRVAHHAALEGWGKDFGQWLTPAQAGRRRWLSKTVGGEGLVRADTLIAARSGDGTYLANADGAPEGNE